MIHNVGSGWARASFQIPLRPSRLLYKEINYWCEGGGPGPDQPDI